MTTKAGAGWRVSPKWAELVRSVLRTRRISLLCLTGAASVSAQEVASLPDTPPSVSAARRSLTDTMPQGIGRIGPFDILPQVSVATYYDDNINNTSTNELDDVVITISPGVLAHAADITGEETVKTFSISYTPSIQIYTDNSDFTDFNQAGGVSGSLTFTRLTLGFSQSVTDQSSPSPDVGGRVDSTVAMTSLTSDYQLGAKTSLEVNGRFTLTENSGLSSSRDLSNDDWINYQVGHRTRVGLGVVFGWVNVDDGADQIYEQIRARARYKITEKLNATVSVGGEFRQYDSDVDDTMNPVWDLSATYAPTEGTTVTFASYQRFSASALSGSQNYLLTGVDLAFFQSLGRRIRFNLTATYNLADYGATVTTTGFLDRQDDIYRIRTGLDYVIRHNWSAGIYYSHDENSSTQDFYTYRKNQVGVQTSWQF